MKINARTSIIVGVILFSAAAFVTISLLTAVFGANNNAPTALLRLGDFLVGAYGLSAWLVVVFLLASGTLAFFPNWTTRSGFYLAVSPISFFTIVAAEKIWRAVLSSPDKSFLIIQFLAIWVIAFLIVAIEYIVTALLYDLVSVSSNTEKKEVRTKPEPIIIDMEPSTSESESVADSFSLEQEFETEAEQDVVDHTSVEESPSHPSDADIDALTIEEETNTEVEESIYVEAETDETKPSSEEVKETPLFIDLNWKENQSAPVRVYEETDFESEPVHFDESDYEGPEIEKDTVIQSDDNAFEPANEIVDEEFDDIDMDVADDEDFADNEIDETDDEDFADNEIDEEDDEDFVDNEIDESDDEIEDDFEETEAIEPLIESSIEPEIEEAVEPPAKKPTRKRGKYTVPAEGILNTYPDGEYWIIDEQTHHASFVLKETLREFKIEAEVTGIRKGPVITMFEILPAPGVKLARIANLQDNIALRLAASSVRIVAPIPGKHAVGIEVPNKDRFIVSFKELIDSHAPEFKKMAIPVVLGKDISGEAQMLDLTATPHLLIAGSTGSGKSVCVNSMILSILYKRSPDQVKMILIDPKIVELKLYNDIPHLLTPVITEPKKAFQALQYCLCEMERRYSMLDKMGVRDIKSYNRRIDERNLAQEKIPYIVVIIDEFADLMATTGKELEGTVARLAAMSRAVGVHLVLATQRPSIDVITGLIKANIPTRIAFMVASKMDSRIIIDQVGSEKLLGKGDMLYASAIDPFPVRIQGTYVSDEEVERVVEYVKQYGEPEYIDDEIFFDEEEEELEPSLFGGDDDPLYDKALEIVLQAGKASASYIQRRLKIGYNRAARLVEEMEQRGIVGPANGSKPREVVHVPR